MAKYRLHGLFRCACFLLGSAAIASLMVGCTHATGIIPDTFRVIAERRKPPPPESEWNRLGIRQKVDDLPPAYVPKGYPLTAPRTESEGIWVTDERDGKRLFVPDAGVDKWSSGVLQGEARKVTT